MGIGVSFVVPVRNGAAMIRGTLESIAAQADGRPLEIVVVDDGSVDGSADEIHAITRQADWPVPTRVIYRDGSGAAAAVNAGIRAAKYPLIAQVDQDLRLQPGWMTNLVAALDDPAIGAAQGYYATDPAASVCARVMGLDLEERYAAITGDTDHVCTGNTIYRADALRRVGFFDERMGYGYDNDMSYRLRDAGYRLTLCRAARSFHLWRDDIAGYCVQQYGFGYGRLDLVAKHSQRFAGDRVSPLPMMLHPLVTLAAIVLLAASRVPGLDAVGRIGPALAIGLLGVLAAERMFVGLRALRRSHDAAALLFPLFHLLRDVVWVTAIAVWGVRRIGRRPLRPADSMQPRSADVQEVRPRREPEPAP